MRVENNPWAAPADLPRETATGPESAPSPLLPLRWDVLFVTLGTTAGFALVTALDTAVDLRMPAWIKGLGALGLGCVFDAAVQGGVLAARTRRGDRKAH